MNPLPGRDDLPPGCLPSDLDRAELERDGGDRERELDERLWREEDKRYWAFLDRITKE